MQNTVQYADRCIKYKRPGLCIFQNALTYLFTSSLLEYFRMLESLLEYLQPVEHKNSSKKMIFAREGESDITTAAEQIIVYLPITFTLPQK